MSVRSDTRYGAQNVHPGGHVGGHPAQTCVGLLAVAEVLHFGFGRRRHLVETFV